MRYSLSAISFVIVGIIVCAAAPPLGIILFVIGWLQGRSAKKQVNGARAAARAKAQRQRDRELMLACRSLS